MDRQRFSIAKYAAVEVGGEASQEFVQAAAEAKWTCCGGGGVDGRGAHFISTLETNARTSRLR